VITIENSFLVDRPADQVYDVFSQVANIAQAFPTVRRVEVIDDDHVSLGIVLKMGLLSLDSNLSVEVTERTRPLRLVAQGVAIPGKGLAAAARIVDREGLTHISMVLDLEDLGPEQCRIRYKLIADAHGNLKRVYTAVIKGQRAKLESEFIRNVATIMGAAITQEEGAAMSAA
jgi:carbon monoxide dehydrogenase subunit G